MKNLKQLFATGTMMAALMVGTTFAGTGLLVSDFAERPKSDDPCAEKTDENNFTGLLVSDFAGLLVSDFTGIIVAGVSRGETVCGIIVAGKN